MKKAFSFLLLLALAYILTSWGGGGVITKPNSPTNLKAERKWDKSGDNLFQKTELSWDPVDNAESYKVYRQAEGETKQTFIGGVSSTTYTDTIPVNLYYLDINYIICAVINGVEAGKSTISTDAPPPPSPW